MDLFFSLNTVEDKNKEIEMLLINNVENFFIKLKAGKLKKEDLSNIASLFSLSELERGLLLLEYYSFLGIKFFNRYFGKLIYVNVLNSKLSEEAKNRIKEICIKNCPEIKDEV